MYIFGLIILIIGLTLGILITKLTNQKQYKKQRVRQNKLLKKQITTLHAQQQELEKYFYQNTKLLNEIISHCQELYQNMTKQSVSILRKNTNEHNIANKLPHVYCYNDLTHNIQTTNKQTPTKEPQDYPANNSSIN